MTEPAAAPAARKTPRVVIVGGGFAGLHAARALRHADAHITLIDRRNHHLFQPLLYQVATAGLAPTQIATPIRAIVRRQKNTDVLMGEVTGVDADARQVKIGNQRIPYDYLVLATGARHAYFGHDEWEPFAPGLKTLEDATSLRARILLAFERAELEPDPAERARLTTFVLIGGGATGVEMAGAIVELAKKALVSDYRRIDPKMARVVLVEAGPKLLAQFPDDLSESARKSLEKLGVEVRLGAAVTGCDAGGVAMGATRIESRCVIWAAGVQSSPAAKWLGATADRAGRAIVGPDLRIDGHREIFVIGDCALASGPGGQPLPGLASVAKQEGKYAGQAILDELAGRPVKPFAYTNYGELATIGRKAAIADFHGLHLRGFIGWLVWSFAHIYFLIGFRNRIAVALDWTWSYLTFERGARLITGGAPGAPIPSKTARQPAPPDRVAG
jgi:NADH dehydrogenase